jgi:hypothetical protein
MWRRVDGTYNSLEVKTSVLVQLSNFYWPSPAQSFLVSDPFGTHDLIYVCSKTVFALENEFSFN